MPQIRSTWGLIPFIGLSVIVVVGALVLWALCLTVGLITLALMVVTVLVLGAYDGVKRLVLRRRVRKLLNGNLPPLRRWF